MKKKIYFLLQHLCIGGIEICVVNVANALVERGYRVVLLSVLIDNELSKQIHPDIEVVHLTSLHCGGHSLFYKLKRRLVSWGTLRKTLRDFKDAILVSTRNEYNVMLSKYASGDNLRIAQLHHDYWGHKRFVKDFRKHYRNIDYFFILTNDVRDEIEKLMEGYNSHTKCVTVPNFYPNKDLPLAEGLERENIALAVGRLSPEKGFLRLLDVWSLVDKQAKNQYMLYIVGEGDERPLIENKIKELNLGNSVRLLGAISNQEVRNLMLKAKVYCMSSFTESFSLVLMESLNNGLPQVAFDVRVGPRNLIVHGQTGYLIPDGDIETYSLRVIELFQNAEEWKGFSAASKSHAILFSEDCVMSKWIQIFDGNR